MKAQRRVTAPPVNMAEVVTSSVRMEVLDGKWVTRCMSVPVSRRRGFAPGFAETPARDTCWETRKPFSSKASPSAPGLSGIPGTGAILF